MQSVEWGEYRLGDLFEIKGNPQLNKDSFVFSEEGKYPYFTRTEFNNGILGYVDYLDEEHKISGCCLAVGMIAMKFFYMEKDFYAGQFTKRAIPKSFKLTPRIATYFISLLNKNQRVFQNILVRHFESEFNKTIVQLPTKNGEIDFDFMESFIAELEAERIAELEAYLMASGLKDYTLTKEEKSVLEEIENGDVEWAEFRIEDLFDVVGTKSLDSNAIDFTETGINFVGRTFENNGIQGKIQKRDFEPNDPFTITATVIGNYKYVKFQVEPYYCSQNINKLTQNANISVWNKNIAYYFVANVQKFVSLYDYQQGGYKLPDIKNHIITIPTQNNQPDYEIMETFMSAIQKLVIKDVVLYADRKIATTQKVVGAQK